VDLLTAGRDKGEAVNTVGVLKQAGSREKIDTGDVK
jgi:hypothetical protein